MLLLLLAATAMVLLWKTSHRHKPLSVRDYPQIMKSGALNVVTDYNSIGYFVSGDSVVGFQYEMLRQLEKSWNIKVNIFLENSLDENFAGLQSQQYDVVARSIPVNSALREKFAFTGSLTLNKQVLVQRKAEFNDSVPPIRSHLDLAKKTIYVPKDSPAMLRLNNLSHEIGDTIYIVEDNTYEAEQLVMMVAAGEIDYTVCNDQVAKQLAEHLPEIDTRTDISFTQLESWAVRKDSPVLLDSLNVWLERFQKTREFKRLYERYY